MPQLQKPRRSLEERFFDFASRLPNCELIDALALTPSQEAAEKADLFFENRTIIGEVKNLAKDTSEKIEAILAPYREHEDFPLFYGEWPLEEIVNRLADAEQIKKRIYEAVSSAIPELVRKANRQIRTTKKTFDNPQARGVLIVLNDLVGILTPEVIAQRIQSTLIKKKPDRSLQFTEIVFIWVISETHFINLTPSLRGIPAIMMEHPDVPAPDVEGFVASLQPKWAAYHGLPLIEMVADGVLPNLGYIEIEKLLGRQEEKFTRSDLWRQQYHDAPYLKPYSKEQLLSYGAKLTQEVGKRFLVGNTSSNEDRIQGIIRWTHFQEEINARRIDLRELKPYLDREGPLI